MTASSEQFYDEFRDRRMLGYYAFGNRRLRRANSFVMSRIRSESRVLEIGCGIGITTARIARKARHGYIWSCDLSSRNIRFARATVGRSNVSFMALDALAEPDKLRAWIDQPVETIVLIDVIEHIPIDRHAELLDTLLHMAADDVEILMTFPTPQYQTYLREHEADELQPVDEDVTAGHLEALATANSLTLDYWRRCDVWLTGQYVHAMLRRRPQLVHAGPFRSKGLRAARRMLGRVVRPLLVRRYRKL